MSSTRWSKVRRITSFPSTVYPRPGLEEQLGYRGIPTDDLQFAVVHPGRPDIAGTARGTRPVRRTDPPDSGWKIRPGCTLMLVGSTHLRLRAMLTPRSWAAWPSPRQVLSVLRLLVREIRMLVHASTSITQTARSWLFS